MTINKSAMLAILLGSCATATIAHADTFTFASTVDDATVVAASLPTGAALAGTMITGTSTTNWANGDTSEETFTCISLTQPPSSGVFSSHMLCNIAGGENSFSITAGCNDANEDGSESNCWGGLLGETGAFEGRTGSVSWHTTETGSAGTGQWN